VQKTCTQKAAAQLIWSGQLDYRRKGFGAQKWEKGEIVETQGSGEEKKGLGPACKKFSPPKDGQNFQTVLRTEFHKPPKYFKGRDCWGKTVTRASPTFVVAVPGGVALKGVTLEERGSIRTRNPAYKNR